MALVQDTEDILYFSRQRNMSALKTTSNINKSNQISTDAKMKRRGGGEGSKKVVGFSPQEKLKTRYGQLDMRRGEQVGFFHDFFERFNNFFGKSLLILAQLCCCRNLLKRTTFSPPLDRTHIYCTVQDIGIDAVAKFCSIEYNKRRWFV